MKRQNWPLFLLFLLCFSPSSHAADINAASCSQNDVQNAINAAVNGDRVLVPAGECTWATTVTIPNSKGITLEGAGAGVTVIKPGHTGNTLRVNMASSNKLTRITGFTFDEDFQNINKSGLNAAISLSGAGTFRIHHNVITGIKTRGVVVSSPAGATLTGLIDNNTIEQGGTSTVQGIFLQCAPAIGNGSASDPANAPFARPYEPGGVLDHIYMEDNTFNYNSIGDATHTGRGGCRYVFRYNTINKTNTEHHGADSGGYRGFHSFEIYRNTYNCVGCSFNLRLFHFRSGAGLVWENAALGTYTSRHLAVYRSCSAQNPVYGGTCDGTVDWDQNIPGFEGWRCLEQPGALFGVAKGSGAVSMPFYQWTNTIDDVVKSFSINPSGGGECSRRETFHIIEDRDYYNHNASFDGTTGVGVGTLANRPATCTPEVAYWATDESKLYKCTATNTWSLHYTPFTYPHPLRGVIPPPTNLRVEN